MLYKTYKNRAAQLAKG